MFRHSLVSFYNKKSGFRAYMTHSGTGNNRNNALRLHRFVTFLLFERFKKGDFLTGG